MTFDLAYFVHLLILLVFCHFLADYPLQGDFLAKAKNRATAIPGVPWWQAMGAHCGIHAGFVYLLTSCWTLAAIEFYVHWVTDSKKCSGKIGFNTDQFIHLLCKVAYAVIVVGAAGVPA
jgi:hypothetical protein